jgi:hypothetical protein
LHKKYFFQNSMSKAYHFFKAITPDDIMKLSYQDTFKTDGKAMVLST